MSGFVKFGLGWVCVAVGIVVICETMHPGTTGALVLGLASGLGYTLSVMRWTEWLG